MLVETVVIGKEGLSKKKRRLPCDFPTTGTYRGEDPIDWTEIGIPDRKKNQRLSYS